MKLSRMEYAAVKRVAKNVKPILTKIKKLQEKQMSLQYEIDSLMNEVNLYEAPIKEKYGVDSDTILNFAGDIPETEEKNQSSSETQETSEDKDKKPQLIFQ